MEIDGLTPDVRVRKSRRLARLWMLLAVVFGLLFVIMTALFIWHAVTYTGTCEHTYSDGTSEEAKDHRSSVFKEPCPGLPSVMSILPHPLPSKLQKVLGDLDSNLQKMIDNATSQPAISTNIFYRDSIIWSGHYGSKRFNDSEARPDNDTVYRIGSITKIFPVLLMYKLYESGKIDSIDDPLSKYAPEFDIKNPFTHENITLREIASQMSGLPREAPCKYHCKDTNSTEQLSLMRNGSLVIAPWTMPSYSNVGYALLGRLLTENLLNKTFENWVQEEILDPLGMKNTGFKITSDVEKNMALLYLLNGTRMPYMEIGWLAPAGEMYSTISDLAKLGMMFTQPSKQSIFKESTLREMSLPVDIAPDGRTVWGSPFEMIFINGFLVRGKGGNIDTYAAFFTFEPQLQLGMNILISTSNFLPSGGLAAIEIGEKAYDTMLPALNQTLFDLQTSAEFPDPKPFTGAYLVNMTNPLTLQTSSFLANITVFQSFLLLKVVNLPSSRYMKIRYIGERLLFQASQHAPGMSCFVERIGVLADMYFDAPEKDGLSHSFSIPGWSITGKRITGSNIEAHSIQTGGDLIDSFFQPAYFT